MKMKGSKTKDLTATNYGNSHVDGDLVIKSTCYSNSPISGTFIYEQPNRYFADGIGYITKKEDMKPVDCLPESLKIKNIAYCDTPGKEKVILVFKDGSKVIKEMCKGDTFDLNIGVALAFMEKVYGSKTQYHKTIQKKLPKKK